MMREEGGYDPSNHGTKIVLEEDGTLRMDDIPDWWFSPYGKSSRSFRSAAGTWLITKDSEWGWSVDLSLPSLDILINLSRRTPPIRYTSSSATRTAEISCTLTGSRNENDHPDPQKCCCILFFGDHYGLAVLLQT